MSNNILSRVQILMDANTASYEQNIKKAGQESTKTFGNIREEASKMGKIVAAGAATAGIALGAMALDAAKNALEIDKMAKTAGVSTQQLMVLQQAGRQYGIETGAVAGAVGDLNEKIFEAVSGNKDSANAFKALGVQVTDAKGNIRAAGDVVKDVANKFSTMSDGATKTAIAARLGGDGFKELIPVLNQGAAGFDAAELSAKKFGNTLSTDTIAQLQVLRGDVGLVTNNFEGFQNQLLTGVAPTLVKISGGLKEATSDVRGMSIAVGTLNELLKIVASAGALTGGAVKQAVSNSAANTSTNLVAAAALIKGDLSGASKIFKSQFAMPWNVDRAEIDKSKAWVQELYDKNSAAADAALAKQKAADAEANAAKLKNSQDTLNKLASLDNAQADKAVDKAKQVAEKLQSAFLQQQSTLQKAIDTAGLSSNFATIHYEVTAGALTKLLPLQKTNLENLAKEADFALLKVKAATERTDLDHQVAVLGKRVGLERTLYDLETGKYKDYLPAQRTDLLNRQRLLVVTQDYQTLLGNIQTDEEKRATTLRDQLDTLNQARSLGVMSSVDFSNNIASTLASGDKLPEFGGIDASITGARGELGKANTASDDLDKAYDSKANIRWQLMQEGRIAEKDYFDSILKLQEDYAKKRLAVDQSINAAQRALATEQLTSASSTMGSLMEITATFASKNSMAYRTMFAVQKAFSIAQSIIAITTGIAQAAANPFPLNLAAMASVAAATASLVGNISSVQAPTPIAHGGLDFVPKEETYLLDKGERVLSPRQNKDFTQMMESDKRLKSGGGSGITVNIENYGSDKAFDVQQLDENTVRIIARDEISRDGGAVAAQALSNPNSSMSKAMSRNTSTQRNRG